ncbi:MAG: polysaccharide deacetylase family protein [Anaerolineales bacterium]|nr:polysaccharide deacetylase family protein [Anaerolineales bacterium]
MISITRRDFLKLSGLSLLSAAFFPFEPAATVYQEQAVLYQGSSHYNRVALTYDDCYLVTMLHKLEEILDQHPDVRITLFPVGEALLNNQNKDPGVWNRFYKKGHEIGYHSFDHTNPQVVSPENVVADYDRWLDALREVLEEEPVVRFARPPFGNTSPSFLFMCAQRGLVPTMWSTGWGGPTESVVNYTVPKIKRGDIVLLHTRPEDMETTTDALPKLAKRGIQPVTLSRLYLDWLKEQNESTGCYADPTSLTRTCIE